MKKSKRMNDYKFLDEFAHKHWKDIEFKVMLKETEEKFFLTRRIITT